MSQEATMEQMLEELIAAAREKVQKWNARKNPAISARILFSEKETSRMEPVFAYTFEERGGIAHVMKQKLENGKFAYTITYKRDGQNITVTHSKLQKAKKAFISETWRMAQ